VAVPTERRTQQRAQYAERAVRARSQTIFASPLSEAELIRQANALGFPNAEQNATTAAKRLLAISPRPPTFDTDTELQLMRRRWLCDHIADMRVLFGHKDPE
jgi:hypothetical protein